MRDHDQRYRRAEVEAVRREADRVDQGQCPHVQPGEPPCARCFLGGDVSE